MALTPEQQALEYITRAKRILVVSKEQVTHDAIASATACVLFLKKLGKTVDVVIPGFDATRAPRFLPAAQEIQKAIGAMRAFQISLDVKDVPLGELMYDVHDQKLRITVIPKYGEWQPKDVSFTYGDDRYNLVIALDCPDMQSLGAIAHEHADFLYRTTIINIDHDVRNEHWGQINLVDLNTVSTTETLFHLFEAWNRHQIDEPLATALLTGMISATKSFRTPNVTPKTLSVASQLVAMGAKREEIVHGLWRTRTIPTLKLWGRALSRLEQDRELGFVWTILTRQDFIETGSSEDVLDDVVSELLAYAPEAKAVALISESVSHAPSHISFHTHPPLSAVEITRPLQGSGTREHATVSLPGSTPFLENAQKSVAQLRSTLSAVKGVY